MAYSGTTAASSVANPPILLVRGLGNTVNQSGAIIGSTAAKITGGNGIWMYASTDGTTAIGANLAYFTDGLALGMRNGDVLINVASAAAGSTSVTMGISILGTTNSTAGFTVMTGGVIQSS